ncbi:MAG: branched-chain amino acid transaminase [Acidobacteriota bacterium]|nr:branched-chain amino acid transaminase [Acidobacteriota bacterium]
MSFGSGKIWMNGNFVDWADAKIHIGSHVIHYGSGVFEGIRCYETPNGSVVFRLDAHLRRLYDSAKVYRMTPTVDQNAFQEAVLETIRTNAYAACYIRPLMYRGYDSLGVNPFSCPVESAILVWEWGAYLGEEALEKGVDVQVSSWSRAAPNTFPALAKSTANYANSQLIKMEATLNGYSEAIALDPSGVVSEGSGQNIFAVRDNVVFTPPMGGSVLRGITRDVIITLARDLGVTVTEQQIPRELLYLADEVFFTGTAAEISPIRSIDKITVGNGARGPVTGALQRRFFEVVNGSVPDTHGWLTPVYDAVTPAPERVAAGKTS